MSRDRVTGATGFAGRRLARQLRAAGHEVREGLRVTAGGTDLGDNARARREPGCAPRPLAAGLRETLEVEMRDLGLRPPAAKAA